MMTKTRKINIAITILVLLVLASFDPIVNHYLWYSSGNSLNRKTLVRSVITLFILALIASWYGGRWGYIVGSIVVFISCLASYEMIFYIHMLDKLTPHYYILPCVIVFTIPIGLLVSKLKHPITIFFTKSRILQLYCRYFVIISIIYLGSLIVWNCITPFHKVTELLTKFENSSSNDNIPAALDCVYNESSYYRFLAESGREYSLAKVFNKFKPGFIIHKLRGGSGPALPNGKKNVDYINVTISKTAKIDNSTRNGFGISLVKINEEWKILYYYFPDFIDY